MSSHEQHHVDELYCDAVNAVKAHGTVSISFLQRKYSIGYNRAAQLVDDMQKNGVVSAPSNIGHRMILSV